MKSAKFGSQKSQEVSSEVAIDQIVDVLDIDESTLYSELISLLYNIMLFVIPRNINIQLVHQHLNHLIHSSMDHQ
jgi:phosphoribosyl-ATP pyrophosphohydrolase